MTIVLLWDLLKVSHHSSPHLFAFTLAPEKKNLLQGELIDSWVVDLKRRSGLSDKVHPCIVSLEQSDRLMI